MKNKYYVYQHTRLDNNTVFYIGVGTKQLIANKYQYYSRSLEKSNRNNLWNKIIKKTTYKIEIIFESNNYEEVLNKEIELIKLYGRINLKTGTLANMTDGGEGILNMSKESIIKRNNKLKGKKRSKEVKNKLSKIKSGSNNPMFNKKHSEETKNKMKVSSKHSRHFLGKKQSEESKLKMSKTRILKHSKGKKVIDTINNIIYDTVTQAALSMNINRGTLSNMLLGKNKNKTNFKYL